MNNTMILLWWIRWIKIVKGNSLPALPFLGFTDNFMCYTYFYQEKKIWRAANFEDFILKIFNWFFLIDYYIW